MTLRSQHVRHRLISALYDEYGGECGSVRVDDDALTRRKGPLAFEAVVLSGAQRCSTFQCTTVSTPPPDKPFYWVMLIGWEEPFAERKGLGYIYRSCGVLCRIKYGRK